MNYLLPVRAIQVAPRYLNKADILKFVEGTDEEVVSFTGNETYEQGASTMNLCYDQDNGSWVAASPGDWIIEVFENEFCLVTDAFFKKNLHTEVYYTGA